MGWALPERKRQFSWEKVAAENGVSDALFSLLYMPLLPAGKAVMGMHRKDSAR